MPNNSASLDEGLELCRACEYQKAKCICGIDREACWRRAKELAGAEVEKMYPKHATKQKREAMERLALKYYAAMIAP